MNAYPTWEETQLRNLDRFDELIAALREQSELTEELRRGMAALAEVMVTKADLDDYVRAGELNSRSRELREETADKLEDYALQNDLDSLRSEMLDAIAEATATPFDPERPTA